MKSKLEEKFETAWSGIPWTDTEYKFHPTRRWRFDYVWEDVKIALEIEGGTFVQGRHNRGAGFQNDCDKYNNAVALGWRVFRYTGKMLDDMSLLKQTLEDNYGVDTSESNTNGGKDRN